MSPSDLLATPSSECLSERCSRYHHWETKQTNFSNVKQSSFFRSHKDKFYDLLTIPSCTSSTKTKVKWKMVWFSMSLYQFKSSLCPPCNQSTQRRRKTYRCKVSSSPIKRAIYETCKYDINHHGWSHHQGEKQIHFLQCRKYPMDSSHHRCHTIFTPLFEMNSIPCI